MRHTEHLVTKVGRGLFRVDDRRGLSVLAALRPAGLALFMEEALRRSPRFSREDSVLGHRSVLLRSPQRANEEAYSERHFTPGRQCALKEVTASAHGLRGHLSRLELIVAR